MHFRKKPVSRVHNVIVVLAGTGTHVCWRNVKIKAFYEWQSFSVNMIDPLLLRFKYMNCTKENDRFKFKSTHTYLALFNDPLDSIWHHLWVKFQAANNTVKLKMWVQALHTATWQQPLKADRESHKGMGATHLRCRSMLAALSNMAVGLAIFLPTACAKGWRAPWKRGETIPKKKKKSTFFFF